MAANFFNSTSDAPVLTRRLDDDVLQSAEEAVLANPTSTAVLQAQGDLQTVKAGSAGSTPKYQQALARQLAQQPFTATLLAFGAGAMVLALLRSIISRRRNRS
jgi:hypothetical protein